MSECFRIGDVAAAAKAICERFPIKNEGPSTFGFDGMGEILMDLFQYDESLEPSVLAEYIQWARYSSGPCEGIIRWDNPRYIPGLCEYVFLGNHIGTNEKPASLEYLRKNIGKDSVTTSDDAHLTSFIQRSCTFRKLYDMQSEDDDDLIDAMIISYCAL